MTGSVALDVAIGLVFIYLLYSLLLSIVSEIVSTWLGIRARTLRLSIERMLNDSAKTTLLNSLGEFILYEFADFKKSFAGRFYKTLSRSLSKGEKEIRISLKQTKPTYFTDEVFADVMIHMFRNKGGGQSDMDRVDFSLRHNTMSIGSETLAHLKDLKTDSKEDLNQFRERLKAWYNEAQDRATGWYKTKVQMILFFMGMILAVALNVDSIKIAKLLAEDNNARDKLVQMGIEASKDDSELAKALRNSQDSSIADSLLLDSYKKTRIASDEASKILGLGWGFDRLLKDDEIRMSPVLFSKVELVLYDIRIIDIQLMAIRKKLVDANTDERTKLLKQGTALKEKRQQKIVIVNSIAGTSFSVVSAFGRWRIRGSPDRIFNTISGKRKYETSERIWYVLVKASNWAPLAGFTITALMLSLGAPFWFDLLKKLVAIRGAGVNPLEKPAADKAPAGRPAVAAGAVPIAAGSPTATPKVVAEDPIDEAVRIYGDEIMKITDVISVIRGYQQDSSKKVEKCLQVFARTNEAAIKVRSAFGKLASSNSAGPPPMNVKVVGTPKKLALPAMPTGGTAEKGIMNSNGLMGWGSFGCLVHDKFLPDKKYILSCYHVMNGDYTWENDGRNCIIIDNHGKEIAKSYEGYRTDTMDVAFCPVDATKIAHYKNQAFVNPKTIRAITDADVFVTKVRIQGLVTNAKGTIEHDSFPATLPYLCGKSRITGKERTMDHSFDDLILIGHSGKGDTITKQGDSGSVVLDDNDVAVGIVVGGDLQHTYAMKISSVLEKLGLELEV